MAAVVALLPAVAVAGDDPDEAHFSHTWYATTEVAVIRGRVGGGSRWPTSRPVGGARVIATARTFAGRDIEEPRLRIAGGGSVR